MFLIKQGSIDLFDIRSSKPSEVLAPVLISLIINEECESFKRENYHEMLICLDNHLESHLASE